MLAAHVHQLPVEVNNVDEPQRPSEKLAKATVACISSISDRLNPLMQSVRMAPVPLATVDREMNYLHISQRWFDDFNLANNYGFFDNVIGANHYEVFPTMRETKPDWVRVHERVMEEGISLSSKGMDSFIDKSGDKIYLTWTVSPWFDRKGSVGGLIMHCGSVQRVSASDLLCPTCHTVVNGENEGTHSHYEQPATRDNCGNIELGAGDRGELS